MLWYALLWLGASDFIPIYKLDIFTIWHITRCRLWINASIRLSRFLPVMFPNFAKVLAILCRYNIYYASDGTLDIHSTII